MMTDQKKKQRERRVQRIARLIATPMTSEDRVSAVATEIGGSRKQAQYALARVRAILRKRHEKTADAEAFEQVERLRLLAQEARDSKDYQAQIAAERMIADIVGTKAASKSEVQVSALKDLRAMLADADESRARGDE